MKKFLRFRWILLTMAALAIIGLTGMNVYSLYALHESTISAAADRQKAQLTDFSFTTRNRFRAPVEGIWKLNMEQLHDEFDQRLTLNSSLADVLFNATEDPLFAAVYFAYPDFDNCSTQGVIQRFDSITRTLTAAVYIPDFICDGLGLTRTRMKVLLQDYRWSTKVVFDTHQTMTVALINPRGAEIVGYLTFEIFNEYLINEYLANQLVEAFGSGDQSGMSVWLHDWLKNEVLATNTPNVPYERRKVQYIQRFPDLLDNWNLKVVFDESPAVIASKANLTRNLLVMGGALTLLLGSLTLMLILAQKERSLLERQAGFLANVTHELKTPLAMMQAAGENLADGRVTNPDRLKTYGKHIHTESLRLRHMIEKLLDVARNDAGQHIVKPQPYSLGVLVQNYMSEHETLIKSSGFDPIVEIPNDNPLVMVDKDGFETIIGNLVENAMKYSLEQKYLAVRLVNDSRTVTLHVEDRGLGIPKKSTKYIFDKFYRAEDTFTARTKGHGLGLSIVKALVDLIGANITVESTYRKGSVFSVTFPIHVASHQTQPQMVNPKAKIEYAS